MKNRRRSGAAVLVLNGEYDRASKDQGRAAFDAVSDARRVVLDFSDVSYVDSMIVRELVRLHNARAVGSLERASIVARNGTLQRIFEILQLESVFRVVESLDEARAEIGEEPTVLYVPAFNGKCGLRPVRSISRVGSSSAQK